MKIKLLFIHLVILLFIGCSDDNQSGEGTLVVRLTDSPEEYEEVLIDVQELLINVADDDEGWTPLPLQVTGQIDLLELANGNDTILTEENLPPGKISQMRMILGNNNQLKKEGEYYDLSTPSAQQSGLKFNIHATLEPGITYEMWIDFDVARSIVRKGNGKYSLKPTIKVFTEATSGAIKGVVSPVEARPLIQAISSTDDTTSTFADEISGEFLIRGLEVGTYELEFEPVEGYQDKNIEGIDVSTGNVTLLDTVFIDAS